MAHRRQGRRNAIPCRSTESLTACRNPPRAADVRIRHPTDVAGQPLNGALKRFQSVELDPDTLPKSRALNEFDLAAHRRPIEDAHTKLWIPARRMPTSLVNVTRSVRRRLDHSSGFTFR